MKKINVKNVVVFFLSLMSTLVYCRFSILGNVQPNFGDKFKHFYYLSRLTRIMV